MRVDHREILQQFSLTDVRLGKQQCQQNLAPLLYLGGSAIDVRNINEIILSNELGQPIFERLELVDKLHKELKSKIAEGGSTLTIRSKIMHLKAFFRLVRHFWAINFNFKCRELFNQLVRSTERSCSPKRNT
jgi:hypothetical protein